MEKAILIGLQLPGTKKNILKNSLAELSRLAETAGAVPVAEILQHRAKADPAYLIGRGKAEELGKLVHEQHITTVLFDDELKPGQQRNLEEIIEAKIIDRTRLILDIFAQRAHTREGILQVERAQLSYYLPRLTKRGIWLDSQVGGIGTRGPGERKLEVDQRRIRERITRLDREIEQVRRQRQIARKQRGESGQPIIAVVGYTNAGKSTLLNALSRSNTSYADDKLFATLDPLTRQVRLPGGRNTLFTDTVGFIDKLPHTLIAAFRATLEEITRADCLLHLIDAAHPDYAHQEHTVLQVLKELHAEHLPIVSAYNKKDLLTPAQRRRLQRQGHFLVSARDGDGITEMLQRIEQIVAPKVFTHELLLPYLKIDRMADIFKMAVVKRQTYTENGVRLKIECTNERWEQLKSLFSTTKNKASILP